MPMDFARIDEAIAACKQHLDSTAMRNTEIESYLVGYLLTVAYADIEQYVKGMVLARASRTNDPDLLTFAKHTSGKVYRGLKLSDLKGILACFSGLCRDAFDTKVTDTVNHAGHDNIILNRHSVAHRSGTNVTLTELETAITGSKIVCAEIAIALGLTLAEVFEL